MRTLHNLIAKMLIAATLSGFATMSAQAGSSTECKISSSPNAGAKVSVGGVTNWFCPAILEAGQYTIDLDIPLTPEMDAPYRVLVEVHVVSGDDGNTFSNVMLTSNVVDFQIPGSPFPSRVLATAGQVSVARGPVAVRLAVVRMYARGEGDGMSGFMVVPQTVQISLHKLP